MIAVFWADLNWPNVAGWSLPVRILATLAAIACGGLGAGLVVQMLSKAVVRQLAPRPAVNLVRVVGGFAAGLAAVLWLFGTGTGFGPGGPGSEGSGGADIGSNRPFADLGEPSTQAKSGAKKAPAHDAPMQPSELQVEILSDKVLSSDNIANKRYYRVTTTSGPKQMSIEDVKQYIADQSSPPSAVILIDYEDSADTDRERAMKVLRQLAGDLKKNPDQWVKPAPQPRESPRT